MNNQPLADSMRPENWDDFIGQEEIVGPGKIIRLALEQGKIPSLILWGPPGTGKTSLARLIARASQGQFIQFSAVVEGIARVREVVKLAQERHQFDGKKTILFVDEIHRFNKAQQDAFLPHIEQGTIILIGATTENPSFAVNNALLSRCRVLVLNQLTEIAIKKILKRALVDKKKGLGSLEIKIEPKAIDFLAQESNGDARIALNTLELAVGASAKNNFKKISINLATVKQAFLKRILSYDRDGEEHYNLISAFIKSMRASDPDAAIYYLARMIAAGEDALFIARRMVIFASEDIGVAQPTALVVANEVFRACETIGYPECQINLAHGAVYLCAAKKNRSSYDAYFKALEDVRLYGSLPVPLSLRNASSKLMKSIGYGVGYEKYPLGKSLLPEKLKGKKYFS